MWGCKQLSGSYKVQGRSSSFTLLNSATTSLTKLDGKWIVAYIIAEPCIGVKDTVRSMRFVPKVISQIDGTELNG
jgi:hypothetical protein